MANDDAVERAREMIASAERIVVFSGAGLSAESGIPTFRDEGGIWERYPPEDFATVAGLIRTFLARPDRVREFVCEAVRDVARAKPNPAHRAIAELEQRRSVAVVTQNVDGLHTEAGSKTVHELHGTLYALQCGRCGRKVDVSRAELRDLADRLIQPLPKLGARTRLTRLMLPMLRRCASCRGRMRPAIVFFGELLPDDVWAAAATVCRGCEAMLVVGTSAQIYPAAMLPAAAHEAGAKVVVVTADPTFAAPWADIIVVGLAGEVVPSILQPVR